MTNVKSKPKLDEFLKSLNQFISSLPPTEPKPILDLFSNKTSEKIKTVPPFRPEVCPSLSGDWSTFHFSPPSSIKVVGSYILQLQVKPVCNIDLAVELPEECFSRRDYLDYRWALKNALYLSHLASNISTWEPVHSVQFFYLNHNTLKPALLIRAKCHSKTEIRLLPHPPHQLFKLAKLLPFENCVRQHLYSELDQPVPSPTPLYNNSLLSTLFYEQHLHSVFAALEQCPALRDAVLLVKVWLRERELDSGWGGFSGFLATMLLVYLLQNASVSSGMTEFQMFRVFILTLSASNWTEEPVSLFPKGEEPPVDPGSFTPFFPVTMVDTSGYVNIAGDLSLSQYYRVRHEAQVSLSLLDCPRAFDLLFHTSVSFLETFDCSVSVDGLQSILSHTVDTVRSEEVPDIKSQLLPAALFKMYKILERGLAERVRLICHTPILFDSWNISEAPPTAPYPDQLTFGFLYSGTEAFSGQLVGPPLDDPENAVFSRLWADKTEMRRFPDGAVCAVVAWPSSTPAESRLIPFLITRHLLATHMGVSPDGITFRGVQLDELLYVSSQNPMAVDVPLPTGESSSSKIQDVFGVLTQKLFALKHLPLRISSVQGTHAVFRGCEVFPPCPAPTGRSLLALLPEGDRPSFLSPDSDLSCPRYTPALSAVLNLATSGKWPDELEAIWRVKTAFYLELSRQLKRLSILSLPTRFFLDVFLEGFVFRFRVSYFREILYMQSCPGTADVTLQMNINADELLFETKTLPTYTATVHGLAQQYSSLSAAIRLAKRWVHAQMLSHHIPDITVEMLVLFLYLHAELHPSPGHHVTAFLRFLSLLGSHDWRNLPIVLNPSNQISEEEAKEIRENFLKFRATLPPLFLASPWDRESQLTRHTPSLPVLNRLVLLARKAHRHLSSCLCSTAPNDLKVVFRPPLDDYDAVIRIKLKFVSRALYAVDPLVVAPAGEREPRRVKIMPVVAFDPVEKFVRELRFRYEQMALFFVDEWGGREIGVVWNPRFLETNSFRVNQCGGRKLKEGSLLMEANLSTVLSDFQMIGGDMIEDIISKQK